MSEHVKVDRVEDGIAYCSVKIPVVMLDDVMAMAEHVIHASRWINTRYRVARAVSNGVSLLKVAKSHVLPLPLRHRA